MTILKLTGLHTALRWLLRVDLPVQKQSEAAIAAEVEQNYRWNFVVNALDGATFWFGLSFISSATILPLFVSKLTTNPLAIGLVAMIAQGGWLAPQLFTANVVERLARKKPVVVNLGFFLERLPMWLIVLAAAIAVWAPRLALLLFFVAYAWHSIGAGIVATAWQDLIARCFPVAKRGRFLGLTIFVGAGAGALAASFSAWLLGSFPFPTNFVYSFALAALFITVSWGFLALTREPVQPSTIPRQTNRDYWAALPQLIRQDDNFRHFLMGRLLIALGGMGMGFVTVTAVQRWQIPNSTVGLYTLALLVGQTVSNLFFGLLADRWGHKLSLELTAVSGFVAFMIAWLAVDPLWYYVVFSLMGIVSGGLAVSGILIVLEFCVPDKRPTYSGLTNTGAGLVGILAPLLGAGLAALGSGWLFGVGALAYLLAFVVLHWQVKEPRFSTVGY